MHLNYDILQTTDRRECILTFTPTESTRGSKCDLELQGQRSKSPTNALNHDILQTIDCKKLILHLHPHNQPWATQCALDPSG